MIESSSKHDQEYHDLKKTHLISLEKIVELEQILIDKNNQINNLNNKILPDIQSKNEIIELKNLDIVNLNQEISILKNQNNDLKSENRNSRQKFSENIKILTENKKDLEDEIDILNKKINDLNTIHSDLINNTKKVKKHISFRKLYFN